MPYFLALPFRASSFSRVSSRASSDARVVCIPDSKFFSSAIRASSCLISRYALFFERREFRMGHECHSSTMLWNLRSRYSSTLLSTGRVSAIFAFSAPEKIIHEEQDDTENEDEKDKGKEIHFRPSP